MYHLFIRINTVNSPLECMVLHNPCAYLHVRSEVARPVTVSHIRKGAYVWVKSEMVADVSCRLVHIARTDHTRANAHCYLG